MQEDILYGIQEIDFGPASPTGAEPDAWVRMENIEEGSVSLTTNQDQKTNITPEDKDTPIVVLTQPGDPDVFNFALLEISQQNLANLFNIIYDAITSKVTVLSKRKHANLAIRFISRPQFGKKKVVTFYNCLCDASYKNNITKSGLLSISVAASILSWKTGTGEDASYTIQKVNEDGSIIDSNPDFDTILDFTSDASPTAEGITATIAATNATIKFKFDAITSPSGTPLNMQVKVGGVTKASVDFPSDYAAQGFAYIDSAGTSHLGTFASGVVNV